MSEAGGNITPFPKQPLERPRITYDRLVGRLGYFTISESNIQLYPDYVLDVMAKCIVLGTWQCPHGGYLYLALSTEFGAVLQGEEPPQYRWQYTQGQGMEPVRMEPKPG